MGQNDTNMQNTPPAFSGQAPSTNPFSAQNTIPSSATGDIVLEPTTPPKKSKKPLIVALLIIVAVAIGGFITVILTTTSSKFSNQANSVSLDQFSQYGNEFGGDIAKLEELIYFGVNNQLSNSEILSEEYHNSLESYNSSLEKYYNSIKQYETVDGNANAVEGFQNLKDTIDNRLKYYSELIEAQNIMIQSIKNEELIENKLGDFSADIQLAGKEVDTYIANAKEVVNSPYKEKCNTLAKANEPECAELLEKSSTLRTFLESSSISTPLFSNIRQNIDYSSENNAIYDKINSLGITIMNGGN